MLAWLFLYAGVGKLAIGFSVEGFLQNAIPAANPVPELWTFFASVPGINYLISIGLILLGLSLLFGIGVRVAAIAGTLMMVMFWFATYPFPKAVVFIVQKNVIYAVLLLAAAYFNAGHYRGLDGKLAQLDVVKNNAVLQTIIG
jgi:thiosulfate dehydrogenase [quinone] large subunit